MNEIKYRSWELKFPKLKQLSLDVVEQCIAINSKVPEIDSHNEKFYVCLDDVFVNHNSTHFMIHATNTQVELIRKLVNQILQIPFDATIIEE